MAAVGAGYAGYSFLGNKANAAAPAPAADTKKTVTETKKTFTGGEQGFVDLKLKEVHDYNHNTKRFIFELPEPDQVSGLHVACKSGNVLMTSAHSSSCHHHQVQSSGSRETHYQTLHAHQ